MRNIVGEESFSRRKNLFPSITVSTKGSIMVHLLILIISVVILSIPISTKASIIYKECSTPYTSNGWGAKILEDEIYITPNTIHIKIQNTTTNPTYGGDATFNIFYQCSDESFWKDECDFGKQKKISLTKNEEKEIELKEDFINKENDTGSCQIIICTLDNQAVLHNCYFEYSNHPPSIQIKTAPSKGYTNEPVIFSFIVSDKDENLSEVAIDCNGDGTADNRKTFRANTGHAEVFLTCNYDSDGTYLWTATAYDTFGKPSDTVNGFISIRTKAFQSTIESSICLDQNCKEKATCLIDWRAYYLRYTIKTDKAIDGKVCIFAKIDDVGKVETITLHEEETSGYISFIYNKEDQKDYGVIRTYLYDENCQEGKLLAVAGDHNLPALENRELEIEKLELDDEEIYLGDSIKLYAKVKGRQENEYAELKYSCFIIIDGEETYELSTDKCEKLLQGKKIELNPNDLGINKSGSYTLTLFIKGNFKGLNYEKLDSWCKNVLGARKSIDITVKNPPNAKLKTDKEVYDFGNVSINSFSDLTIEITNTGEISASIKAIKIENNTENAFSITENGCKNKTLVSGESCQLKIRFSPLETVQYNSILVVEYKDKYNGHKDLRVPIEGTGKGIASIQVIPHELTFEDTEVNSFSEKKLTIENNGNVGIVIKNTKNENLAFYIYENHCINKILDPSGKCTLVVRFEPTTEKEYRDYIKIEYYPIDDTENIISAEIPVTGIGYYPVENSNHPPFLTTKISPSEGYKGKPVTFTFVVSDEDNNLSKLILDCDGDGTPDSHKTFYINTGYAEVSLTCNYNSAGTYTWTATAYDTFEKPSNTVMGTISIKDSNYPPAVSFEITLEDGLLLSKLEQESLPVVVYPYEVRNNYLLKLRIGNKFCKSTDVKIYKIWESDEYCDDILTGNDLAQPEYYYKDETKSFTIRKDGCEITISLTKTLPAGTYSILVENSEEELEVFRFSFYLSPEEKLENFISSLSSFSFKDLLVSAADPFVFTDIHDLHEINNYINEYGEICILRYYEDFYKSNIASCLAGASIGASIGSLGFGVGALVGAKAGCEIGLMANAAKYIAEAALAYVGKRAENIEYNYPYILLLSEKQLITLCADHITYDPINQKILVDIANCLSPLISENRDDVILLADSITLSDVPVCQFNIERIDLNLPLSVIEIPLKREKYCYISGSCSKIKYFILLSKKPLVKLIYGFSSVIHTSDPFKLIDRKYSLLNSELASEEILPNFLSAIKAYELCNRTQLCRIESIYIPFNGFYPFDELLRKLSLQDRELSYLALFVQNGELPVIVKYSGTFPKESIEATWSKEAEYIKEYYSGKKLISFKYIDPYVIISYRTSGGYETDVINVYTYSIEYKFLYDSYGKLQEYYIGAQENPINAKELCLTLSEENADTLTEHLKSFCYFDLYKRAKNRKVSRSVGEITTKSLEKLLAKLSIREIREFRLFVNLRLFDKFIESLESAGYKRRNITSIEADYIRKELHDVTDKDLKEIIDNAFDFFRVYFKEVKVNRSRYELIYLTPDVKKISEKINDPTKLYSVLLRITSEISHTHLHNVESLNLIKESLEESKKKLVESIYRNLFKILKIGEEVEYTTLHTVFKKDNKEFIKLVEDSILQIIGRLGDGRIGGEIDLNKPIESVLFKETDKGIKVFDFQAQKAGFALYKKGNKIYMITFYPAYRIGG
ncbi:choice-of-anchor D domain-containing protein [Phorcysia thermohydrogeniphila]|nr:choice-of-anchor D domain-containing protein [Phorcysia thermohydrogeniphila]